MQTMNRRAFGSRVAIVAIAAAVVHIAPDLVASQRSGGEANSYRAVAVLKNDQWIDVKFDDLRQHDRFLMWDLGTKNPVEDGNTMYMAMGHADRGSVRADAIMRWERDTWVHTPKPEVSQLAKA